MIQIQNETSSTLQEVHFTYRGGSNQIGILRSNQTFTALIPSTGTSPLILDFKSQEGIQVSTNLDVYFEKNYKGTITVKVMQNGDLLVRSNVEL